jgi:putative transposase
MRYSEDQIIGILNEADDGMLVRKLSREYVISDAIIYSWK